MDFLFVPGGSTAEVLGRTVIARRPGTRLITPPARQNHVAGFIAQLLALPQAQRPIGDIVLVAHGNETGEYFIPLSGRVPSPADFERADDANTANSIRLTAPLLTPVGGGPMNTITVRLKGCNIGQARPFIEMLRTAMGPAGGSLNMTAPLQFDEFHGIRGGHVEYLAHKFTVTAQQQFTASAGLSARDALLAAFDAKGFTYLDGTPIPAAAWGAWVPRDIHLARGRTRQSFDTRVDLSPAVHGQTVVTIKREYRYETTPFAWDWRAPNPGTRAGQLNVLLTTLPQGTVPPSNRQLYDPSYAWPLYERYGFASLNDFVNNLNWRISFSSGVLRFRAVRHEYTVMLPVTDPPGPPPSPGAPAPPPVMTIYNYYPQRAATGPAVMNIPETDARLFLIL